MKNNAFVGAFLMSFFLALASAGAKENAPENTTEIGPLEPGSNVGAKIGENRFELTFEPTKIEGMGLVRAKFEKEGNFQLILDGLADEIALPQNIPVTFKDCGEDNAFWDRDERSMTMCWELIALYNRGYEAIEGQEREFLAAADRDTVLTGTTTFIFLHELGHGLIDLFDLPITGREEDAADQFAALVLLGDDEESAKGTELSDRTSWLALLGAYFFKTIAVEPDELEREILSGEHALGQQRYYDVMCLVLGSDEETYGPILTPGLVMVSEAIEKEPDRFDDEKENDWLLKTDELNILPYERALKCDYEYRRYSASWSYLFSAFTVPQAAE